MAVTVRRNWDGNNNNQIDPESIESSAKTVITQDEGIEVDPVATTLNFIGTGVTATDAGLNVTDVTISGGGGSALEVEDEGVSLTTGATKFNFVGAGVTATQPVADEITVTIPGGNGIYAEDFGDAAASNFVITHNLGTKDLDIACWDNASPFDEIYPTISRTSANTITIDTGLTTPAIDQYRVFISSGGGAASGGSIETQDEGILIDAGATTLNFVGAGVTATNAGSNVTDVTIPGGGGSAIEVEDEGISLTTGVIKFNFVGAGVAATQPVADEITVTIPGGDIPVFESILTGNLQLFENSETYQVLNPNGTPRQVVVPSTPSGNLYFVIINDSDGLSSNGNTLLLKESLGGTTIATLDDTTGLTNIRVLYTGTKYVWF